VQNSPSRWTTSGSTTSRTNASGFALLLGRRRGAEPTASTARVFATRRTPPFDPADPAIVCRAKPMGGAATPRPETRASSTPTRWPSMAREPRTGGNPASGALTTRHRRLPGRCKVHRPEHRPSPRYVYVMQFRRPPGPRRMGPSPSPIRLPTSAYVSLRAETRTPNNLRGLAKLLPYELRRLLPKGPVCNAARASRSSDRGSRGLADGHPRSRPPDVRPGGGRSTPPPVRSHRVTGFRFDGPGVLMDDSAGLA